MSVAIAEYLGNRVDLPVHNVIPSVRGGVPVPTCPFSGGACIKLAHNPPLHPVCSVRVFDAQTSGRVFIVCSNRLIPAQATAMSPAHVAALASIAQTVFPGVMAQDVGFKRQVGINLDPGRLTLDYVLHVEPACGYVAGPRKVILEVQGGGETSNTGTITRYVDDWIRQRPPTNAFLSRQLDTAYLRQHLGIQKVNVPGIIPNNAWKRQLEQILKKAVIAKNFGGAFALVTGDLLYDYMRRSVPVGGAFFADWEVALIGVSESSSAQVGAIPMDSVSRSAFMTFDEFIAALQTFALPQGLSDPFAGRFTTLTNNSFSIP
jgi:hypothetical protein